MVSIFIALLISTQIPQVSSIGQEKVDLEKARLVKSNVIGLDLTNYNIKLTNYFSDNPKIYGGLTHDVMLFNLTSQENSLYVMCQFINDKLVIYNLYQITGLSPIYLHPNPATINAATENAVERYNSYSSLQQFQDMRNLIRNIPDSKPENISEGSLKLVVRTPDNYNTTQIDWVKNINGADYPTGLSVHLNKNNVVQFSDLTSFYSIGNTDIEISREQAIIIAQKEAFGNNILNVTNEEGINQQVTLELPFEPQNVRLSAICREPLTYSPLWQIQFYAKNPIGGTTCYQVGIWADTGLIEYSHLTSEFGVTDSKNLTRQDTSGDQESKIDAQITDQGIYVVIGVAIVIALALIVMLTRRKRSQ
jgi:hypothetical protein